MKKLKFTSTSLKSSRGFSLLEVCLALTLLVLISGSIYAVLRGSMDTAAALRDDLKRSQEIEGIISLCKRTFHMLPSEARLESFISEESGAALPQLIVRNAPQLLSWGPPGDLDTVSILGLRPQTGGRYSLSLLRVNGGANPSADPTSKAKPADWMALVADVTKLNWRFYDAASNTWLDVLSPGQARPRAVEMTIALADEPKPIRAVFELVPMDTTIRNLLIP